MVVPRLGRAEHAQDIGLQGECIYNRSSRWMAASYLAVCLYPAMVISSLILLRRGFGKILTTCIQYHRSTYSAQPFLICTFLTPLSSHSLNRLLSHPCQFRETHGPTSGIGHTLQSIHFPPYGLTLPFPTPPAPGLTYGDAFALAERSLFSPIFRVEDEG